MNICGYLFVFKDTDFLLLRLFIWRTHFLGHYLAELLNVIKYRNTLSAATHKQQQNRHQTNTLSHICKGIKLSYKKDAEDMLLTNPNIQNHLEPFFYRYYMDFLVLVFCILIMIPCDKQKILAIQLF